MITGQVKFRPANSSAKAHLKVFENFVYGNNVGIYQSKYGLQKYEFLYLRHADVEAAIVGLSQEKAQANSGEAKASPMAEQAKNYEVLDRFSSNPISIGTFNIFMTLTCDLPLVGANEAVNLSWVIYGVPYKVLADAKSRNCIGFYKVEGCGGCSKIEIIPTSAYLEVGRTEPCPGRMLAVAPKEPGIYEIRFLFNFFKEAQLHRQCQVFGDLEDQMQQLRIRSFFEKRTLADEVQKFAVREPHAWGIARMNTYAWLKSMLLSTVRESVDKSVMESTEKFSKFLYGRLKSKLTKGLANKSKVYQSRIKKMVAPLYRNGFMGVLEAALASNSQMNDQLASIVLLSPTEEDEKNKGLNPYRDALLLPSDRDLLTYGPSGFRLLARNYLNTRSLCGYHDFVDDIVLYQVQLLNVVDQVMSNLASSCVMLYESAIQLAAAEMMKEAEVLGRENAMQGIDAILIDLCRNHIQSIVRAFVETDCRTGLKWKRPASGTVERIAALRRGSIPSNNDLVEAQAAPALPGGDAPVTRQYLAVRRWIRPRLERKIITILRQRYARLLSGNLPLLAQMARTAVACFGGSPSLVGNPFPAYRANRDKSALYFLEESRVSGQKSAAAAATGASNQEDETPEDEEEEEPKEEEEEEEEGEEDEEPKDDDEDEQEDDGDDDMGEELDDGDNQDEAEMDDADE